MNLSKRYLSKVLEGKVEGFNESWKKRYDVIRDNIDERIKELIGPPRERQYVRVPQLPPMITPYENPYTIGDFVDRSQWSRSGDLPRRTPTITYTDNTAMQMDHRAFVEEIFKNNSGARK